MPIHAHYLLKMYLFADTTPCLKKLCKFVLSELRQISTNFDIFWQKDAKEVELCKVHNSNINSANSAPLTP